MFKLRKSSQNIKHIIQHLPLGACNQGSSNHTNGTASIAIKFGSKQCLSKYSSSLFLNPSSNRKHARSNPQFILNSCNSKSLDGLKYLISLTQFCILDPTKEVQSSFHMAAFKWLKIVFMLSPAKPNTEVHRVLTSCLLQTYPVFTFLLFQFHVYISSRSCCIHCFKMISSSG